MAANVKPGATLVRKDTGLAAVFKSLKELPHYQVTVGIQGTDLAAHYPDGTPVVVVALANEFGTKRIPARGFMRRAAQAAEEGAAVQAAQVTVENIIDGGDPVKEFAEVGRDLLDLVLDQIEGAPSWAKPDSNETIEAKGSTKPLVDSGKLLNSMSWAVRKDGEIVEGGKS